MPGVVITGGSSGIGRSVAEAFGRSGWDVGFTWRSGADRAKELQAELAERGVTCVDRQVDLADVAAAATAIDQLLEAVPDVQVLVNNAGVNRRHAFLTESPDRWREVMEINALAPLVCAQRAAATWLGAGSGGRIINVSSSLESLALEGGSAYCMSKAALRMLTQVMALELAPQGITVLGVSPGETATPMVFDSVEPGAKVPRPVIPVGRSGVAEDVAKVIVDLCHSAYDYMTGQTIVLDGGLSLRTGPDTLQRELAVR